jgi:hypothetical protein
MRNIVLAAIAAITLSACFDTSLPTPVPWQEKLDLARTCNRPPQLPPLRYTAGDPVEVEKYFWDDHVEWVQAVTDWSDCATKYSGDDNSQKVLQACNNRPDSPAWSATYDNAQNAYINHDVWMAHIAWVNAMEAWTVCADSTNPM